MSLGANQVVSSNWRDRTRQPEKAASFWADTALAAFMAWALFGHTFLTIMAVLLQRDTRTLTIGSRMAVLGIAAWLILSKVVSGQRREKAFTVGSLAFVGFWIIYLVRMAFQYSPNTYIAGSDETMDYAVMMSVGVCFIPSLAILLTREWRMQRQVFAFSFTLAAIAATGMVLAYKATLVNFEGRTRSGLYEGEFMTLHSLTLGYHGAYLIILGIFLLVEKIGPIWLQGGVAVPPILLGGLLLVGSASRGPMLALVLVTLVYLISKMSVGRIKQTVLVLAGGVASVILLAIYIEMTGSVLFRRVFNLAEDIATGQRSAGRLDLYYSSYLQFLRSPIIGDSFIPDIGRYPHNLILESMMATGVIGTLVLLVLLYHSIKSSWYILKYQPKAAWVALLYLFALSGAMFSWSIYNNFLLWYSMAATIGYYNYCIANARGVIR